MGLKTALFDTHNAMGARMVPFGGWDMPLHYGSQLKEHHAVRQHAGMFDVSHMLALDISGAGSEGFLRMLLANDVARLKQQGKALYSCMLNPDGGVIDDLIVYFMAPGRYRMVVNAGTADKDLAWMEQQAQGHEVMLQARRDLVMPLLPQRLQGPASELKSFFAAEDGDWLVARTGYTGEDGFELSMPAAESAACWKALAAAGVAPCGLGARDTLRLEAGMNLYGHDMDESTSPLEAGLAWTIAWEPQEREFIGRQVLEAQRDKGDNLQFVGLVLEGRGVLRDHLKLFSGDTELGEITSGGFGPTLNKSIALARIRTGYGDSCEVDLRGKRLAVRVVNLPFVRHGEVKV
ncbi:MAG: glycine cleavage system aminomethyltransferase GcvT [Gammaproteobacteria bacterium]